VLGLPAGAVEHHRERRRPVGVVARRYVEQRVAPASPDPERLESGSGRDGRARSAGSRAGGEAAAARRAGILHRRDLGDGLGAAARAERRDAGGAGEEEAAARERPGRETVVQRHASRPGCRWWGARGVARGLRVPAHDGFQRGAFAPVGRRPGR
jgi:hypothetical protein